MIHLSGSALQSTDLIGLFFVTVGFSIDVRFIGTHLRLVGGMLGGLLALKAAVITSLGLGFGMSVSQSQQTGLSKR